MKASDHQNQLHIIAISPLHVRFWDSACVIFDQRCGETHLLEGPAGLIFGWLHRKSCTAAELIARLQAEPLGEHVDPESFVNQLLAELERQQLVEQLPADGE